METAKALIDFNKWRSHKSILSRIFPPYCRGGSAETIFGFSVYGDESEKLWFKLTLGAYREYVLKLIDSVYWLIRYRTFSRHHIVRTDLKPGWCDVDEVMFRACFALLGRFVEGELGAARVDEEHYRCYRLHCLGGTDESAIDLWLWYKEELPKIEAEQERDYRAFIDTHGYDYIEDIKTEKLNELIQMRRTLWT